MFLHLLLHVLSWANIDALNGDITQTISLPPVPIDLSRGSSSVIIDCVDSVTSTNSSFKAWKKIWRVNSSETFDANKLIFINNNASVEFDSADAASFGAFECCIHMYAYEDFTCFATELQITSSNNIEVEKEEQRSVENETETSTVAVSTTTEKPLAPSWNVNLTDGETLFAKEGHSYFIKIFWLKVTDINCTINGEVEENLRTNNILPANLNSDVLIAFFNSTIHEGDYVCDASYRKSENDTETLTREFHVVSSDDSNMHADQLDAQLVESFLKGTSTTFGSVLLIVIALCLH